MKIVFAFISLIMGLLIVTSCATKECAYIDDAQRDSAQVILHNYASTIHPGDQLYIYVYSQVPEVSAPFNQESYSYLYDVSSINQNISHTSSFKSDESIRQNLTDLIYGYDVSKEGYILFPILGKMYVEGITLDSLSKRIESQLVLDGYVIDPQVTVSLMNMRVSVIGEVNYPKEIHVSGDRLTIFEALAMCGDMTIYGRRDNVVVMREKNGTMKPIQIDLTHKNMFDSEVYYLQSNDVVYIEPNKIRKRKSRINGDGAYYVAMAVSITDIARTMYKIRINNYLPSTKEQ